MLRRKSGRTKKGEIHSTKWDDGQREIIYKYQRAHLLQQETERLQKEKTKDRCREVDPRCRYNDVE